MNSIIELQDLCNTAVQISKNDLMIYWIGVLKSQSNNKSMLETFDLMISKLQQDYVDEYDTPAFIAERTWGLGSCEMFRPIVDIHECYYVDVLGKINLFFMNEILILSKDDGFQTVAKNVQTNLQVAFHIPNDVLHDKESKNSTFHNLKGKYSTWFNNRDKTGVFLDYNFNKLRNLVVEEQSWQSEQKGLY